eukprot:TCALIF_07228-PA protein Name:"Similar to Xxylt1 Xyloside xylosyltransferase 1 (Mus musculus)" AED:0.37 eAED:0.42 QI:0/0/0/0.33/0.5/0.66/3/0/403
MRREYFDVKTFEDGILHVETVHHEPIEIPVGETVHAVIAMPFLDVNPLGATEYIQTLEWLLIYCTVPLTLHIITNTDSIPYVERIVDRVNKTASSEFHAQIVSLADIMEETSNNICPKLTVSEEFCDILMGKMTPLLFPYLFPKLDHAIYIDREIVFQDDIGFLFQTLNTSNNICPKLTVSEEFCDILMGKMTPLLFPYLFPKLDHAIYIDREIVFQDDIGFLFQTLNTMKKKSKAALGLAPEQTNTYMRSFAGWQRVNPTTRLGRPPPEGKPGYNPSLMLMDLEKLRASVQFKTYFSEIRLNKLMKQYLFHSSADIPSLGDIINLMAADNENMFYNIGCEWNRNSRSSTDLLDKKYNVCPGVNHIRAWHGNPDQERILAVKEKNISVGRRRVVDEDELLNMP